MISTVTVARVMRYAGVLAGAGCLFWGVGVKGRCGRPQDGKSKSGAKQQADEKKDDKKDEKKEETLPLKTTRKVSFTTDEGTWMSIDMSPDGKQIVFDLLGDLYVIPVDRRRCEAIDERAGVGLPAAIFTEWEADCVYQRPERQRQSLADQCGRLADRGQGSEESERRDGRSAGIAGVVTRWKLHRGAEVRAVSGADGLFALYESLDVSQGRRQGC